MAKSMLVTTKPSSNLFPIQDIHAFRYNQIIAVHESMLKALLLLSHNNAKILRVLIRLVLEWYEQELQNRI